MPSIRPEAGYVQSLTARFLNVVEAALPAGRLIHCILGDCGIHKLPRVWRKGFIHVRSLTRSTCHH